MKCPYCSKDAVKMKTGNTGNNPLYLMEGDDCFDTAISYFKCTNNSEHTFYCDDLEGNEIDDDMTDEVVDEVNEMFKAKSNVIILDQF